MSDDQKLWVAVVAVLAGLGIWLRGWWGLGLVVTASLIAVIFLPSSKDDTKT